MSRNIFEQHTPQEEPEEPLGTPLEILEDEISELESRLREKRKQWMDLKRRKNTP